MKKPSKSDDEWKVCLSPEQFRILRGKGTELPFTGRLLHEKRKGVFACAACGAELFSSDSKFDSGTGWPSFFKPISEKSIETKEDRSLLMSRTEVLCKKCGGHLGHLFKDGPKPTGLRFCMNSGALEFREEK